MSDESIWLTLVRYIQSPRGVHMPGMAQDQAQALSVELAEIISTRPGAFEAVMHERFDQLTALIEGPSGDFRGAWQHGASLLASLLHRSMPWLRSEVPFLSLADPKPMLELVVRALNRPECLVFHGTASLVFEKITELAIGWLERAGAEAVASWGLPIALQDASRCATTNQRLPTMLPSTAEIAQMDPDEVLARIAAYMGLDSDVVEKRLAPGQLSVDGFLAVGQHIGREIVRDAQELAALGVDHQAIVERMELALTITSHGESSTQLLDDLVGYPVELQKALDREARWRTHLETELGPPDLGGTWSSPWLVTLTRYRGFQADPLHTLDISGLLHSYGSNDVEFVHESTGEGFKTGNLTIELIRRACFFQGKGTPHRVEPTQAARVLGLLGDDPLAGRRRPRERAPASSPRVESLAADASSMSEQQIWRTCLAYAEGLRRASRKSIEELEAFEATLAEIVRVQPGVLERLMCAQFSELAKEPFDDRDFASPLARLVFAARWRGATSFEDHEPLEFAAKADPRLMLELCLMAVNDLDSLGSGALGQESYRAVSGLAEVWLERAGADALARWRVPSALQDALRCRDTGERLPPLLPSTTDIARMDCGEVRSQIAAYVGLPSHILERRMWPGQLSYGGFVATGQHLGLQIVSDAKRLVALGVDHRAIAARIDLCLLASFCRSREDDPDAWAHLEAMLGPPDSDDGTWTLPWSVRPKNFGERIADPLHILDAFAPKPRVSAAELEFEHEQTGKQWRCDLVMVELVRRACLFGGRGTRRRIEPEEAARFFGLLGDDPLAGRLTSHDA